MLTSTLAVIIFIALGAFFYGRNNVRRQYSSAPSPKKGKQLLTKFHSLPRFYGVTSFLWTLFPASLFYALLHATKPLTPFTDGDIATLALLGAIVSFALSTQVLTPSFKARNHVEKWVRTMLILSAVIAIAITVMIIFSVFFESARFFTKVPLTDFLFGTHWSPEGSEYGPDGKITGGFGAVPVFLGTLLITFIAMCVAAPLGLLSAIYLSEYASSRFRNIAKPILEILAGIPTVVYGFFAALAFAPFLMDIGAMLGLDVAAESALAAGIVMGIMIIPFVMSLSDDVMKSVPYALREASMGLGATKSETIRKVIFPAALPGIVGALLLAVSRGIGETMIVVMAAGLAANLTVNPLDSVTTVTAQIVTLLKGDQAFDSPQTLSAFALALTLFVTTLILNLVALIVVRKFREKYE